MKLLAIVTLVLCTAIFTSFFTGYLDAGVCDIGYDYSESPGTYLGLDK